MKRKVMLSLFVIFLAAAIIGGATMAWFTAKADAPENVFTAGTVMIEAGDEFVWGGDMGNVNPGDCFVKCIEIENTGTKSIELRLEDVGFDVTINEDWLGAHFEELCFGEDDYADLAALMEAYAAGAFENPAFLAPCPDSGWVMEYVKDENDNISGFNFYYADGPIAPGEKVSLCVVVAFDGEMMSNIWQAAVWNQLNGQFQAVQASNDAPDEVWGAGWDWADGMNDEEALREGTSNSYADYFWQDNVFQYLDCCVELDFLASSANEWMTLYGRWCERTVFKIELDPAKYTYPGFEGKTWPDNPNSYMMEVVIDVGGTAYDDDYRFGFHGPGGLHGGNTDITGGYTNHRNPDGTRTPYQDDAVTGYSAFESNGKLVYTFTIDWEAMGIDKPENVELHVFGGAGGNCPATKSRAFLIEYFDPGI